MGFDGTESLAIHNAVRDHVYVAHIPDSPTMWVLCDSDNIDRSGKLRLFSYYPSADNDHRSYLKDISVRVQRYRGYTEEVAETKTGQEPLKERFLQTAAFLESLLEERKTIGSIEEFS